MSLSALYDLPAPAKLNLFLHVIGRRADGYHLLQSVFRLIDWCDTLHLERRSDGVVSREDLGPALPEDDLCTRAARLLQQATGTREGVHIAIDKQVPWGAGLGGGSSDAATGGCFWRVLRCSPWPRWAAGWRAHKPCWWPHARCRAWAVRWCRPWRCRSS